MPISTGVFSVSTVVPLLLRCFLAVFSIVRRAHTRFSAAMMGRSLIISCRNSKNSGKRLIEASSVQSAPRRSALARRHYPFHEAVHCRRVGPAQDRDEIQQSEQQQKIQRWIEHISADDRPVEQFVESAEQQRRRKLVRSRRVFQSMTSKAG